MSDLPKVSVFGLGKVGITLVAALVGKGFRVTGVDLDPQQIEAFNNRTFRTDEPGVNEALAAAPGLFVATLSAEEAVAQSDFSYIIVPTPSNSLGGFSNRFVVQVLESIGAAVAKKSTPYTVSLVSTVLPGSSESELIPALERASGRKIGQGLGYAYNPSFIAQGEVMKGIVTPEYAIIGESDPVAGEVVERITKALIENNAPVMRLTPIEAEITKLASNTHETMRVAFANMLLALCNEVPDADVDKITSALAYRLGRRFFKGAVPYGGPCWPRDNQALAAFMDLLGVPSVLPNAIDQANHYHGRYVLREILESVPRGGSVGLLGLAYKPGTSIIERSFGIDAARWLSAEGRTVVGWDPEANQEARKALGDTIRIVDRPEDCFGCDAVVVLLPLTGLRAIDWSAAKSLVIDTWRVLTPEQQAAVGEYMPMGRDRQAEDLPHLPIGSSRFKMLVN